MEDIKFNMNDYATIYPTEIGWNAMFIALEYKFSKIPGAKIDAQRWLDARKTAEGGYREQLWSIMQDFGHLIYMGGNKITTNMILHKRISK